MIVTLLVTVHVNYSIYSCALSHIATYTKSKRRDDMIIPINLVCVLLGNVVSRHEFNYLLCHMVYGCRLESYMN